MAWPICPECGRKDVPRKDGAAEITPAESTVFRSYRCSCGWSCWTAEKVICLNPSSCRLRRKYEDSGPPAVQTSSREG